MTTPKASSRVPKHPAARVLEENLEDHGGVKREGSKVSHPKEKTLSNLLHTV